MACLNTLKQEIKTLEAVFNKTHERFQIVSASVDELNCKFIGRNGKRYEIHANITVSVYVLVSLFERNFEDVVRLKLFLAFVFIVSEVLCGYMQTMGQLVGRPLERFGVFHTCFNIYVIESIEVW